MTYALIIDGVVSKYPYSKAQLVRDNSQTSFPNIMTDEELAEWGVVKVEFTAEPEYDAKINELLWGIPEQVDGVWYHTWRIENLSPETIESNLQSARQSASLTPLEFRLGLLSINELDNIEAAIPNMSKEIQIMWEYATSFERMHPQLLQMAEQMQYTEEQLDALFGISQ